MVRGGDQLDLFVHDHDPFGGFDRCIDLGFYFAHSLVDLASDFIAQVIPFFLELFKVMKGIGPAYDRLDFVEFRMMSLPGFCQDHPGQIIGHSHTVDELDPLFLGFHRQFPRIEVSRSIRPSLSKFEITLRGQAF